MKGYGFVFEVPDPNEKLRLGNTNQYILIDDAIKRMTEADKEGKFYIDKLIEERSLRCSYCDKPLIVPHYNVLSYRPEGKPMVLHLFCHNQKCGRSFIKEHKLPIETGDKNGQR